MTFKENVPDVRNSKVVDIVKELGQFGVAMQLHDPLASADDVQEEYGLKLVAMDDLEPADAVILAVAHKDYVAGGWPLVKSLLRNGQGIVLDVKSRLDRAQRPEGVSLWRL
jgi:UDP-N-acetyl-D-galactosamine dehydrogenase